MKDKKISIIVPVYNSRKFLRSIDCILAQSFRDFELIIVDDGSTDGTSEVCDKYANKDSRLKVIHQQNAGASTARNTGIESSTCEFITFVDADDTISMDYIEALFSDYNKAFDADFVIQGMVQKWSERETVFRMEDEVYDLSTEQGLRFFEKVKINDFAGPCCKIFRRSILDKNNIRFNENIIYAEDFDFMLRYLMQCKIVITSSATNYYYIMHAGTVSSKIYEFDKELCGLRQLFCSYTTILERYFSNALLSYRNEAINAYVWRVIYSNYRYKYSYSQRISNFDAIEDDIIKYFASNYKGESLFTTSVKWLFVHRYFKIMDILLSYRFRDICRCE